MVILVENSHQEERVSLTLQTKSLFSPWTKFCSQKEVWLSLHIYPGRVLREILSSEVEYQLIKDAMFAEVSKDEFFDESK